MNKNEISKEQVFMACGSNLDFKTVFKATCAFYCAQAFITLIGISVITVLSIIAILFCK
jgi:hypothetical protein